MNQILKSASWYLFCFLCSLFAKGLLLITGWTLPNKVKYDKVVKEPKVVYIFSHSSLWDSVIFSLMCIAKPEIYQDVYTIMKPQMFDKLGGRFKTLLESFRFIPATSRDTQGLGFVNNIVDRLVSKEKFKIMISPKGTINKAEWRSGYYWIANGLSCKLAVIGLDYETKELKVGQVYSYDDEKLIDRLKTDLGTIVPLYPECEICNVDYNYADISVIDPLILSTFISTFWCLTYTYSYNSFVYVCGLLSAIFSIAYHMNHEPDTLLRILEFYICSFSLGVYFLSLCWYRIVPTDLSWYFLILLTALFYYSVSGRQHHRKRTKTYIYIHSLFHLSLGYVLIWPLM